MRNDKPGGPNSDPFLTIRQVADELGISERSVWRLIEVHAESKRMLGS